MTMSAKPTQLSDQLVRTAANRLENPTTLTPADLRRATSDLYYAMFHRVCEALVAPIGSDPSNAAFVDTFRTLYRLPDHAYLEKRCREIKDHAFSPSVKAFALQVVVLKNKRQDADYDPLSRFKISAVQNDVKLVRELLDEFNKAEFAEQSRFAYFVSLRGRKD